MLVKERTSEEDQILMEKLQCVIQKVELRPLKKVAILNDRFLRQTKDFILEEA